jgi:hypothetical protein
MFSLSPPTIAGNDGGNGKLWTEGKKRQHANSAPRNACMCRGMEDAIVKTYGQTLAVVAEDHVKKRTP